MSAFNDIRQALEERVVQLSGIPDANHRKWENARFDPPTGETWIRTTLIPNEQRPSARGDNALTRADGFLVVDVFIPENQGPAEADTLADTIRGGYTVSTVLTNNGTAVRFDYAERNEGSFDAPWYSVSVTIKWYAYF